MVASLAAHALTPAERTLLTGSLRPSERNAVVRALGGLDGLPLKSVDVAVYPNERRMEGHARLEWRNTTGANVQTLFVRLSANTAHEDGPSVQWSGVEASVDGAPFVAVSLENQSPTLRRITLPKVLAAGRRVTLQGRLSGTLARVSAADTDLVSAGTRAVQGHARGKSQTTHHGTFACDVEICTLTGFAPDVPAFINGAFDLEESPGIGDAAYSEPSNLMLSVVVPADAVVAATGSEVGRVTESDSRRRWTYVMAGSREAAVVVSSHFVVDEATVNGVRIRSYSLDRHQPGGMRALVAATGAFSAFDSALGRYPWTELSIVESALIGGAGGVELSGLTLGATALYKSEAPTGGGLAAFATMAAGLQRELLDFVTRREVAHQWWHASVGSHPQLHPWVDEPLAQWSALYATRIADGPAAARRARQVQVELNFHAYNMMGGSDAPAARAAKDFDDPQQYAALMYGKAPLFFSALSKQIGEKQMLQALRQYAARHRFKRAGPDDLRMTFVKAAGTKGPEVAALWKRWFQETKGVEDLGTMDPMSLLGLIGGSDVDAQRPDARTNQRASPNPSFDQLRKHLDSFE